MTDQELSFPLFVRQVIDALQAAGVDYLIGGALAVWAWGEPRSTMDLDLVVRLPVEAVNALSAELAQRGLLVPPEVFLDNLLEDRGDLAVNAVHPFSGLKAELFPLRAGDDLRRSALARRRLVNLGPEIGEVYVHAPEDLILYKLLYTSLSQQSKHVRDILSILRSHPDTLDLAYLRAWVTRLNLDSLWADLWAFAQEEP